MRFKVDENRPVEVADLDFADIRYYPPGAAAGIIVLRPATQSIASILRLLQRLLPLLAEQPVAGALWIVDERRVRIRGAGGI